MPTLAAVVTFDPQEPPPREKVSPSRGARSRAGPVGLSPRKPGSAAIVFELVHGPLPCCPPGALLARLGAADVAQAGGGEGPTPCREIDRGKGRESAKRSRDLGLERPSAG